MFPASVTHNVYKCNVNFLKPLLSVYMYFLNLVYILNKHWLAPFFFVHPDFRYIEMMLVDPI